MPVTHHLSAHEPLLVNLLGHSAGALIFGIFLALLWKDRVRRPWRESRLTLLSAALAFVWNLGSLIVLASGSPDHPMVEVTVVLATSALSLLPAVLLDLLLGGELRPAAWCGYAVSAVAVALHAAELLPGQPQVHTPALIVTAVGFGALAIVSMVLRPKLSGATAALALFLFALSFAHFHGQGALGVWQAELIFHHAGIPLALLVLLQDYRFVLVDAFLRFLANFLLAAAFVYAAYEISGVLGILPVPLPGPRLLALATSAACVALIGFALLRSAVQRLLTRLLFRRAAPDAVLDFLANAPIESEPEFLRLAAQKIAEYFSAEPVDGGRTEASVQVGGGSGNPSTISLGRRTGGRRYLSEDFALLARFAALASDRLESHRQEEMRRLMAQAELRALQAQIHPHFLFNTLNTLYGLIPRDASVARQTVLDLSDILRFFFRTGQSTVPLEEELRIVESYLAIESHRLGEKLRFSIDVEPAAARVPIPILTVQPLVENAVRHGVTPQIEGGAIRVEAKVEDGRLAVAVTDDGPGFPEAPTPDDRPHVGLDNVRNRLRLCYGSAAGLTVESARGRTVVAFRVPLSGPAAEG